MNPDNPNFRDTELPLKAQLYDFEKSIILRVYRLSNNNKSLTARRLHMSRTKLINKLQEYETDRIRDTN